jgi:predicted  nucleic acid-binding Zn-ribbon protein
VNGLADDKRLERIEDLLTQLISNVGSVRSELNDFRNSVEAELGKTNFGLEHVDGQIARLNQRLDHQLSRIAKVEENVHILNETQQQ